jgi:hypothetical protein
MDETDSSALGERIADLEALLDRVVGDPALQRRLHDEIARLRALQVLDRERRKHDIDKRSEPT